MIKKTVLSGKEARALSIFEIWSAKAKNGVVFTDGLDYFIKTLQGSDLLVINGNTKLGDILDIEDGENVIIEKEVF